MAGRNKQVYKITYPNGKIYVGMDLTGTSLTSVALAPKARSPPTWLSTPRLHRTQTILWESDTATDAEVRAMEVKLIREHGSNDPRSATT